MTRTYDPNAELVVRDLDTGEIVGEYVHTEEDAVCYRRPDDTTSWAPGDCVEVVARSSEAVMEREASNVGLLDRLRLIAIVLLRRGVTVGELHAAVDAAARQVADEREVAR